MRITNPLAGPPGVKFYGTRIVTLGIMTQALSTGLMGAFGEAFPGAKASGRADLSILDADSRVDLTGEMALRPGEDPLNVYRFFLRDNAFGAGTDHRFALTGLNGKAVVEREARCKMPMQFCG